MQLGLALPHYDFSFPGAAPGVAGPGARGTLEGALGYAGRAEALGFHQVWVSDHFWTDLRRYGGPAGPQGTPECWTTLAAVAVRTSRVRLGSLVMPVGLRPPTLLAKMAATLDRLCGGRLDLGLGIGWNELEFTGNGLEFPPAGQRLEMLEEGLGVLRALLAGPAGSFQGRWYQALDAPISPGAVQRPRPPLWVGGSGDRLLGVVARAADGWNLCWSVTPEVYRQRLRVLAAACERAGRDPGEVRRSLGLHTLVGRDADDLAERWRRLQAWAPGGALDGMALRDWAEGHLVGTPGQVLAQLRQWADLGVEQLVCSFASAPFALFEEEQLDLVAELVLPRLG